MKKDDVVCKKRAVPKAETGQRRRALNDSTNRRRTHTIAVPEIEMIDVRERDDAIVGNLRGSQINILNLVLEH